MSIPLIQEATKDAINTSIIAIKRNIERINMLIGLSNSEEIDTSVFATKEELQQAVTDLQPVDEVALNNMHSVTSNAVAKAGSFSYTKHFTGRYWVDGKPIYRIVYTGTANSTTGLNLIANPISNLDAVIELYGMVYWKNDWGIIGGSGLSIPSVITLQYTTANDRQQGLFLNYPSSGYTSFHYYRIILEYTKTTN